MWGRRGNDGTVKYSTVQHTTEGCPAPLLLLGRNIEHEVHDISVLHNVLLALLSVLARRLDARHRLFSIA